MCLLIVMSRTRADYPLIFGANRDERLDRAAIPMTVLRERDPMIVGGRDELAGGTWLAVNEYGVVAGLTNRPTAIRRDPAKRSRGELPIALTSYPSAKEAVEVFKVEYNPSDFNPSWLLVGDRHHLFSVDMSEGVEPVVTELPPGTYVLENKPLGAPSPKVDNVRRLLAETGNNLEAVLSNHEIPPGVVDGERPAAISAACVHTEHYGTRWSGIVEVPADPAALPAFRYSDGPSCTGSFRLARLGATRGGSPGILG
jgi:uncharacterized protein with NRDE domain